MKWYRIGLMGLLSLLCVTTGFAAGAKANNQTDLSYTLGYTTGQRIAQGMAQQHINLSKADFAQGISDAVQGKNGRLSPAQMQQILDDFQSKMLFKSQKQAQGAIEANRAQLVNSRQSPTVGNPKGSVTLIEFFDYQCVHCRRLAPSIAALVDKDPNLRVVYKEFPIFGKDSEFATRAALAANMQGKYSAFHNALMGSTKPLTNEQVLALAKQAKLNIRRLKKDMHSPAVDKEIKDNRALAQALNIAVTPSLIITTSDAVNNPVTDAKSVDDLTSIFIPGEAPIAVLQDAIGKVGKKANGKTTPLPTVTQPQLSTDVWQGV